MMPPKKFADNPVIWPESAWEGGILIPEMVLWNAAERKFQMWYDALHGDKTGFNNLGTEDVSSMFRPTPRKGRVLVGKSR